VFTTGDGLNTAGIQWQQKAGANRDQHNLRIDQNFSESERLTVNYTRESNYGALYANSSLPTVPSGYNTSLNTFLSGALTSTLTPRMVNQFVVGFLNPVQDRDNRYDEQVPSLNGVFKKLPPDQNVNRTFFPDGAIPFLMSPT